MRNQKRTSWRRRGCPFKKKKKSKRSKANDLSNSYYQGNVTPRAPCAAPLTQTLSHGPIEKLCTWCLLRGTEPVRLPVVVVSSSAFLKQLCPASALCRAPEEEEQTHTHGKKLPPSFYFNFYSPAVSSLFMHFFSVLIRFFLLKHFWCVGVSFAVRGAEKQLCLYI